MRVAGKFILAAVWALAIGATGWADVLVLTVRGSINPATKDYVLRGLELAAREASEAVVLELDTPGGLDSSMKDIVEGILASPVPVVVWVGPPGARAASAGTFILLAAHIAAMAPGTSVGAAHPVLLTGENPEKGDVMQEKMENDAASRIRSIAELRGRNADWAERAVRESITATASEALELGVIDLVADSLDDLLAQLDGRNLPNGRVLHTQGVPVRRVAMGLKERLFSYLADPNLVYILLMLGIYGLIYEFFSPGIGIGLVVGGISLLLALLGLQILPINLVGIGLILFGALLMVLDAFTPTNGILTTGGVVSLVIGSFSLFDIASPVLQLSWVTIAVTVGTLTTILAFILLKALFAQRRPTRHFVSLVGLRGVAKTDLSPEGWVLIKGEYWRARARDDVRAGDEVEVVDQEGKLLTVRRLPRN
jgi:membrane-bound serine protease (ClpP class)